MTGAGWQLGAAPGFYGWRSGKIVTAGTPHRKTCELLAFPGVYSLRAHDGIKAANATNGGLRAAYIAAIGSCVA